MTTAKATSKHHPATPVDVKEHISKKRHHSFRRERRIKTVSVLDMSLMFPRRIQRQNKNTRRWLIVVGFFFIIVDHAAFGWSPQQPQPQPQQRWHQEQQQQQQQQQQQWQKHHDHHQTATNYFASPSLQQQDSSATTTAPTTATTTTFLQKEENDLTSRTARSTSTVIATSPTSYYFYETMMMTSSAATAEASSSSIENVEDKNNDDEDWKLFQQNLQDLIRNSACDSILERGRFCLAIGDQQQGQGLQRNDDSSLLCHLLDGIASHSEWIPKTTLMYADQDILSDREDSSLFQIEAEWKDAQIIDPISNNRGKRNTKSKTPHQDIIQLSCSEYVRKLRSLSSKILPRLSNSGRTDTDVPVLDLVILVINENDSNEGGRAYPKEVDDLEDHHHQQQQQKKKRKKNKKKKKKATNIPWVVPVDNHDGTSPTSITLSLPVLKAAKQVVVVVAGEMGGEHHLHPAAVETNNWKPTLRDSLTNNCIWMVAPPRQQAQSKARRSPVQQQIQQGRYFTTTTTSSYDHHPDLSKNNFVSSSMRSYADSLSVAAAAAASSSSSMRQQQKLQNHDDRRGRRINMGSYLDSLERQFSRQANNPIDVVREEEERYVFSSLGTTAQTNDINSSFEAFCHRHGQGI